MSRFRSRGILWGPLLLLAWMASVLPTLVLAVLLHDRHVTAVDLACAYPAVTTVRLERGAPRELLGEAAARCHVGYEQSMSLPPQPVPFSTRTWLFASSPAADSHLGSVLPLLATALPGYALLLGLVGMRSGRRRDARSRAWLTQLASGVLLCLGVAAAAGLVVVHHDVSVTREDFQCSI